MPANSRGTAAPTDTPLLQAVTSSLDALQAYSAGYKAMLLSGTGPQVLDFQAVVWGPATGQVRALRPLAGDTVGMAIGNNDNGQVVGASGTCANTVLPPLAYGSRAVLWDAAGRLTTSAIWARAR